MAAYVIFMRESPVRDPAGFAEYQRMNRENAKNPNLKPLVVYGAMEALEGDAPDGVIVLEFPTMDEAKAWYNSPEYQAALPHRLKSADYRGFIVEGL